MPNAAPRTCNHCGQPRTAGQPCPCRPTPFATSKHPGNTRKWRRYRAAQLRAYPICNYPDCPRPAVTVDHVTPLAEGGAMYDHGNLQSLCDDHRRLKDTADAQRGKTRTR
jgi:5-methylcytosine-specific restriction enzyme A